MRFKIEGREYEWDNTRLTVEEAMEFQDHAHIGVNELNPALIRGNPYATVTLVYLAKKRAGEAVRWQDLKGLDLATYEVLAEESAEDGDESGESESEGEPQRPDPTSKGGKTRKAGTTATS